MKILSAVEDIRVTPAFGLEKGVVIFVHGEWHGGWCWEHSFTETFNRNGFRCITFNLPGHDRPGEQAEVQQLRMRDYLLTLEHVVKRVGGNPILIGHSLGAYLIQHYLTEHTSPMAVLLAPPPPDRSMNFLRKAFWKPYWWKAIFTRRMHLAVSTPKRAAWALFSPELGKSDIDRHTGMLSDESLSVLAEMLWKAPPARKALPTPCLVIAGEKDRIFPVNDQLKAYGEMGYGIIVMPGMGHDLMLEPQSKRLAEIIINCVETKLGIRKSGTHLRPLGQRTLWDQPIHPTSRGTNRWY